MYLTCMQCLPTDRCILPYASPNSQLKAMAYPILIFERAFLRHLFRFLAGLANHPQSPPTLDLVHPIGLVTSLLDGFGCGRTIDGGLSFGDGFGLGKVDGRL
ncbi:hypothetical protein HanRHA438_Chr09g0421431 [Helianthus annuus]|nr:hypothetical protein HanRHA438_Chr09g0421431 [Helianthus annuus]